MKVIDMRKKLLSKTYLRDVKEYILKIDFSNDDYWYSVKKIIDTEPFIISSGLTVIENGYYIKKCTYYYFYKSISGFYYK